MIGLLLLGTAAGVFWPHAVTALFTATGWKLHPWFLSWESRGLVLALTWVCSGWFYRDSLLNAIRFLWRISPRSSVVAIGAIGLLTLFLIQWFHGWGSDEMNVVASTVIGALIIAGGSYWLNHLKPLPAVGVGNGAALQDRRPEDARKIASLEAELAAAKQNYKPPESPSAPTYTPTRLVLKLEGTRDKTVATESSNIWRWQVLTMEVDGGPNGGKTTGHAVFIVFDKPLGSPLKIETKFARPLPFVVQDLNSRSVVLNIAGDLFNNTLEVEVSKGSGWTQQEARPRMVGISIKGIDNPIVENSKVTISGPGENVGIEVEGGIGARVSGNTVEMRASPKPELAPESRDPNQ